MHILALLKEQILGKLLRIRSLIHPITAVVALAINFDLQTRLMFSNIRDALFVFRRNSNVCDVFLGRKSNQQLVHVAHNDDYVLVSLCSKITA